jgi:hypothetical protein
MLNKKEGEPPMPEEPNEKKKADESEEAKKAAAIARYDEAFAGLDPAKFENESDGEELAPASTIEDEVEAIDEMLEGKDEKFNKLKY